MTEELLNCPICLNDVKLNSYQDCVYEIYQIGCCGIQTKGHFTKQEAIAVWNRRANQGKWILCEEKLPDKRCYVWLYSIYDHEPDKAWFDGEVFTKPNFASPYSRVIKNPIAWMEYNVPQIPECINNEI